MFVMEELDLSAGARLWPLPSPPRPLLALALALTALRWRTGGSVC